MGDAGDLAEVLYETCKHEALSFGEYPAERHPFLPSNSLRRYPGNHRFFFHSRTEALFVAVVRLDTVVVSAKTITVPEARRDFSA